jgi:DGQHR domain-containing protein
VLRFKAVEVIDAGRKQYIGSVPVYDLIDKRFVSPVASKGLAPEVLEVVSKKNGSAPVQRRTNPAHVQRIVDYIIAQAENGEPWAFNGLVLYSTSEVTFKGVSIGINSAGEVEASDPFSVGEGLHRTLAWGVAQGTIKVRGVKCPEMSEGARKRIAGASIPVILVQEGNLVRQKQDFHALNQQKPLTSSVLALTDDTVLTVLTKMLVADVALFHDRVDLNSASVGTNSENLLSFSQVRFVAASYLLGKKTRETKRINEAVEEIVQARGKNNVRDELRQVFTLIATNLGGLERLHSGKTGAKSPADFVRMLRKETLLASNALWRAVAVALHDAKEAGIDPEDAMKKVVEDPSISWSRDAKFFRGSIVGLDEDGKVTGKIISSREAIDTASDKLAAVMKS